MKTLNTENRPHRTAKYPHIDFEVDDTRKTQVQELLQDSQNIPVKYVKATTEEVLEPIVQYVDRDKFESVYLTVERVKPAVKKIVFVLLDFCKASGFLLGVILFYFVKYSLILIAGFVGGLFTSLIESFRNVKQYDDDLIDDDNCSSQYNQYNTYNNSNVNIQNNYYR